MSRACINELTQEITDLQAKAALNQKDRSVFNNLCFTEKDCLPNF